MLAIPRKRIQDSKVGAEASGADQARAIVCDLAAPPFPTAKYSVILADPPWSYYGDPNKDAAAGKHYTLMSTADIAALQVRSIAARKAALFLWATGPRLPAALEAMSQWGFHFRGIAYVWARGALVEWRTYHLNQFVEQLERWMPEQAWNKCAGDTVMRRDLPVYACVRVAHDHRSAAVAVAQKQGDGVVVRVRNFPDVPLAEGEYVLAESAELGRQLARVVARATPKGWTIASANGETIVGAQAAMLAAHRALTAPAPPSRTVRGV